MKRFHRATIILDFDSQFDAVDWIQTVTKNPPRQAEVFATKVKILFNNCRICGIDRKFNTLGTGVIGDPADECRASHAMACQRRVEKDANSNS